MKGVFEMTKDVDKYPISLLWDKWKHHDSLAYSRWTDSATVQGFACAGTFLTIRFIFDGEYVSTLVTLLLLTFLWGLAAYSTKMLSNSMIIDIKVRNTFNKEIVEHMIKLSILKGTNESWGVSSYSVDKDGETHSHPINLWHTPDPFKMGTKSRATFTVKNMMGLFFKVNTILATFFLVFFLNTAFNGIVEASKKNVNIETQPQALEADID